MAVVVLIAVGVWFVESSDHSGSSGPLAPGAVLTPVAAPVSVNVISCDVSVPGYATAKVSVTPHENYSYVGLSGDFTDTSGTVIGQGIGNLSSVTKDQTYTTDVIYQLAGSGSGGTCHVRVDTAY